MEKQLVSTQQLLKTALENNNSEFRFLAHYTEWQALAQFRLDLRKLLRGLGRLSRKLSKEYRKQISTMQMDAALLVALKQILHCYEFYKKEYETALDMSDEYINYVLSGHILDTLMGYSRPERDMYDSRKREE